MFFLSRSSHSRSRRSLRRSNLWNDFFSHSIGWLSAGLLDENVSEARITHLFIIQSCRQCEDASLWVQRENIVRPIGNHCVCKHWVGAEVWVGCGYQPYLIAAWCILRDVERVSRFGEQRRVIVGISDLKREKNLVDIIKIRRITDWNSWRIIQPNSLTSIRILIKIMIDGFSNWFYQ